MAEVTTVIVPEGPGATMTTSEVWLPGFSTVHLEYDNHGPQGQTRALLTIAWTDFNRRGERRVEAELTTGDIAAIIGRLDAFLTAIEDDDEPLA